MKISEDLLCAAPPQKKSTNSSETRSSVRLWTVQSIHIQTYFKKKEKNRFDKQHF